MILLIAALPSERTFATRQWSELFSTQLAHSVEGRDMGTGAETVGGGSDLGSITQLTKPPTVSSSTAAQIHLSLLLHRLARRREDRDAWDLLYRRLRPALIARISRLLHGNSQLVEDATQEVFLRIFRYSKFEKNLTDAKAFRAYLKVVCRNVVSQLCLKQKNKLDGPLQSIRSNSARPDHSARPDQQAAAREVLQQARCQLRNLDREVFELLVEGCDLREIAQRTGLPYFTAGARLCRLRARWQRFFGGRVKKRSRSDF
jgi:RNA polymerase sigma factor (sigma-70 family)